MRVLLGLLLVAMLAVPLTAAHGAAPPPSYTTRLLADCNDDYHGGDGNIGGREGHDLHSLDVREAWTQALGHHLIFKVILNGEDDETVTLDVKADDTSKSYDWVRSGSSWSGTFDQVTHIEDHNGDDEDPRFAIEGKVKRSTLGVSVGDTLTDYMLTGKSGGEEHDHVPGADEQLGGCNDDTVFERPEYTLAGPVQYIESRFEDDDVEVEEGKEKFVTLTIQSKARGTRDFHQVSQSAVVTVDGQGAQVRLHDPATGEYVGDATFDLAERGTPGGDTASIHVAIQGDTPGTGSATVTATTSLGGRITDTLDFEITPASAGTQTGGTDVTTTTQGDEDSPGVPLAAAVLALALLAARRR